MAQQIKEDKSFKVHINQGEMYQIQEWVSKDQNTETGGDLFGLWLDDHTAVVQFVLGPGKKCRRTTTSFFQDVEYLQQAGSYLTDKQGLCNIGQWHSHHRLSLSKPSHGDENTVWGNMPVLGLNRYIVFIANITKEVTVNCFLFHYQGRKRSLTKGQFKYLDGNSPLRLNDMVLQNTSDGLESFISPATEREMKFLRDNDANKDGIETSAGENCGGQVKKAIFSRDIDAKEDLNIVNDDNDEIRMENIEQSNGISPVNPKITATHFGSVGVNKKSSKESYVDNESSMPILLSYIRLSDNTGTDVRKILAPNYHKHEQTLEQEYKKSPNKNQATLEGRGNTPSGTIQSKESRHKNKGNKTIRNVQGLFNTCLGKTPEQISDKPHSKPEAKHEVRENQNEDTYDTKL